MNKEGRKPFRGKAKIKSTFTITEEGNVALTLIAEAMGLPSRSEVIEELARQKLAELEAIANDDTAA